MTLSDLTSIVQRLVSNRSYITSDDIKLALNNAQEQLAVYKYSDRRGRIVELHFPELEKTTTESLSANVYSYDFPSTALSVNALHFMYDTSNSKYRELNPQDWLQFVSLDVSRDRDPVSWARRGRKWYITPHPGSDQAGKTILVTYYDKPATLSASGDEPELPTSFHRCIAYLAGHDLLAELNDPYSEKILALLINKLSNLQDPESLTAAVGPFHRPSPGV